MNLGRPVASHSFKVFQKEDFQLPVVPTPTRQTQEKSSSHRWAAVDRAPPRAALLRLRTGSRAEPSRVVAGAVRPCSAPYCCSAPWAAPVAGRAAGPFCGTPRACCWARTDPCGRLRRRALGGCAGPVSGGTRAGRARRRPGGRLGRRARREGSNRGGSLQVRRVVPASGSAGSGTSCLFPGKLYRHFTTEASQATLASVSPVFAVVSTGG